MGRIAWLSLLLVLVVAQRAVGEVAQPDDQTRRQLKLNYQKRINPAFEIPRYPEYYAWVITGKTAGLQVYESEVPVWGFDYGNFRLLGKIPVGTTVTLDHFTEMQGRLYYAVKITSPAGKDQRGWVDGAVIERDDTKSYAPAK